MHSLDDVMRTHTDISIDQEVNFPSWLVEYNKVHPAIPDVMHTCNLTMLLSDLELCAKASLIDSSQQPSSNI